MLIKLYSAATQAYEILRIVIYSLRKWPFSLWLHFWMTKKLETIVGLNGVNVAIRTKSFFSKSADISMAYECIARDDYQLHYLNIKENGVIIDIGAHIGSFSLAAARKFSKAKILSFEPSPTNFAALERNIRLNKFWNIKPFNKAVSATESGISFYINPINSAANSIYNFNGLEVKVQSITLKKILEENRIEKCGFLKMDCEGAEYDILLNAPEEVLRKIETIAIEYHSPEHFGIKNKEYNLQNLLAKLKNAGFRCSLKKMKHYQGVLVARRFG